MKKVYLGLLFLSLFLSFSTAIAQDYYVSATGSNNNNGLTPETPFATIQKAGDVVNPGGTVFIMNGTYRRTTFGSVLEMKRSGAPDAYITFKPYPGHNPIITAYGGSWNAMVIDASYIILDGLELVGDNANLTLEGAEESYRQSRQTPAVFNAKYNTNAISIGGTNTPHHIIVRNCKVHDFPGGGIGAGRCDYVTIEDNLVYNNSWYTMYATSGISTLGANPIDNITTYKMIIRRNVVHNNKTQVKWRASSGNDRLSDGNGIIIDANNGGQGTPIYTGRTLVENNVVYNNGGGGIHAYLSARVDIINNTAFNNGTVVGYPEIDGQNVTDVRIFNNIMYARPGGNCNLNDAGAAYNFNVYFNGPVLKSGANDVVVDPQFVNPTKDATADFRLKSTSPIINTGSNAAGQFSATDILNNARPKGSRTDRGAYEYLSGTQSQTITFPSLPIGKKAGEADFNPGATATSGLPVIYRSSNTSVASIVDNKIRFEGPGTVTITAAQNGDATFNNAPDFARSLTVLDDGFRVSENPTSSINGLDYSYYEGQWTTLPNFKTLTPVKSGNTSGGVDLSPRTREDNFGFSFKGFIDIPASGLYTFYTSSDDGSQLFIGETLVVNNDGIHPETEQSGTIGLKKGKHAVTINYFNASANKNLTVSYASPAIAKTIIPATSFFRANPNLVLNPTFDVNTSNWNLSVGGGAAAAVELVEKVGYTGKAAKLNITAPGTGAHQIQFRTNVPLVKDYTYVVRFRANAETARTIDFLLQMDVSPFSNNFSRFGLSLTATPTYYTFTFTAPRTDASNLLKFNVGNSTIPVYIDEVEVVRAFSPEIVVKQEEIEITDNTGTFNFGNVPLGTSKTVAFTIENTGNNTLFLTDNPEVALAGTGFFLAKDAPTSLAPNQKATFDIRFQPDAVKAFTGTVSIINNDFNENPYNFALTAVGIKQEQTIAFTQPAAITYGEPNPTLAATSSSGLPVTFTVISGPGTLTGNILSYSVAGPIVVEASQAGNSTYNAAVPVQQTITIHKKELLITADNKTVTYGDTAPEYTYKITGFVLGQTAADISGIPAVSSAYLPTTSATESPVIAIETGTLSAANYSFQFVNGQVTIHKKELTVTADNKTVTYGDAVPEYTYTMAGFVNNQTAADITGTPVLSSTYITFTPATETPIIQVTAGSLSSANYQFTMVNGTITIKHTFPLFLEAETAVLNGGKAVATFAGFTGSGYVDKLNKKDDFIQWTANASGTGTVTLTFRYALNNPTQQLALTVNGQLIHPQVTFTKTGNWRNWQTVSVSAPIVAGFNTIQLNGSGIAGPSIDHLVIDNYVPGNILSIKSPDTEFVSNPWPTSVNDASLKVYPIPSRNDLNIAVEAHFRDKISISISDMQGRIRFEKAYVAAQDGLNTFNLDVKTLANGTYLIQVMTPKSSNTRQLIIAK